MKGIEVLILRVSNKPFGGVCAAFFIFFGESFFVGELLSGCFFCGVLGAGGAAAFAFGMMRPLVTGIDVWRGSKPYCPTN